MSNYDIRVTKVPDGQTWKLKLSTTHPHLKSSGSSCANKHLNFSIAPTCLGPHRPGGQRALSDSTVHVAFAQDALCSILP